MPRRSLFATLLAASLVAGCDSPRTQLDAHEVAIAAKALASLAGEAELLAGELAAGHVSEDFAWVQQQALGEESVKLAGQLGKPVPESLRPAHETLSAANARLQSQLTRVGQAANSRAVLEALQAEFHRIAGQAKPLGKDA